MASARAVDRWCDASCLLLVFEVVAASQAEVLDVEDGLVEEVGDVRVVQRIDHPASLALADDQAEMPEDAQLVRHRRWLHSDRLGDLTDRARRIAQPAEDLQAAR